MPMSGDVYTCGVCETTVKILNGSDTPPLCCGAEMELETDNLKLNKIPDDKNICGGVLGCQKCNFKVIVVNDQGTVPRHHMEDLEMTSDRTSGEWDQIYKCDSCGQIVKITKEGCGPLRCCDADVCIMDVAQVKEVKDQIEIELGKVHDKPYQDPYFICKECERELKVIKPGEGEVICHGKNMEKRARIRYYFQGGG
jgi:desulfoferrodoxin-like iron-binding protein